ncbi:unnamed protein product [Spirodela intermedia]|uniref:Fucosyltransferase n=1 Tax=Spirodela intermedia TaxID=51605 RepID=A0A7I8JWX2_SPIIN|nr:unnamed protein product [Spirodela intermedia]
MNHQFRAGFVDFFFSRGQSSALRDEYYGGLLAGGFDDGGFCLSRNQSAMLRKPSPYKPSTYLVKMLRRYEDRHRRCGPHTASYNKTTEFLKSRGAAARSAEMECKYVIWTPLAGLGNRILSLSSTFLYAVLTGRVLLIDRGKDFSSLMCEPFPGTTWLLPRDFPISNMRSFGLGDALSYGSLLRNKRIRNDVVDRPVSGPPPPPFVYVHLVGDYSLQDIFFFCEQDQLALREVPWLLVRSDNYFVPALFLNSIFEPELRFMFHEKEAVFHHLCRYLFHPTNKVWGMVTSYYQTYLAAATERVGIQIRVFDKGEAPFEVVLRQVINCTLQEKLLPWVDQKGAVSEADRRKTKAVLITSLYSGYLEGIQNMYLEHPAAGGMLVSFHQPSHEERQVKDKEDHDMKAWAEMNLLGFADVLITSAQSTFGYIGQALGGVKPWILLRPEKAAVPEPACVRDISMEPCFHSVPHYVCREKKNGDNSKLVPYVTHCKDAPWGIKLVDQAV